MRVVFDDTVRPASGIRAIRNGGGSVLGGKPRVVGGKTLVVPLRNGLGNGAYTVLWRIVSDDGHTEAGVLSFAVGANSAPPLPSLSASSGPTAREVAARLLFFAGLLVAAGGALFRILVGRARVGVLMPALAAVALGALGLLVGGPSLGTRFGLAYLVAGSLAGIGAACAALALLRPRFAVGAWTAALLVLPAPSFAGHALDPGRFRGDVAVDVLHLAAAAVLTGGAVQLLSVRDRQLVRRFAAIALFAVLVLAATGILRAVDELRSVAQIWTTGYGRLLIVKTAVLGLLVGFAWVRRYRLVLSAELVLLVGLVVAVAILTDARPGVSHAVAAPEEIGAPPLPPPGAVVLAREDGDNALTIAALPRAIRVTAFDGQGVGLNHLTVSVSGVNASSCGPGCYEAQTTQRGAVGVVVNGRGFLFRLPRKRVDATALVERATRNFRSLRSVTYVERLASSLRNHIVSTFTLEAPNRVEYHIHGGAAGIVIGTRRWDRTGKTWTESASTLLPQPSPIWGTQITNAYLLSKTRQSMVVSFLKRDIPAWFTVRFDRRLRPQVLDMTATAHFMHHRYTAFNAPRRIFPPR